MHRIILRYWPSKRRSSGWSSRFHRNVWWKKTSIVEGRLKSEGSEGWKLLG